MDTSVSPRLLSDLSRSSGGAFAALVWEWLITLDDEVNTVWSRPNASWLKWIFLFSRYFPLCIHTLSRAVEYGVRFDVVRDGGLVRAWYTGQVIAASLLVSSLEIILMARVYALHSQSKWLKHFLVFLLASENIVAIIGLCLTLPHKNFDPHSITTHLPKSFAYFGFSAITVQIILLSFTIHKYLRLPCKTIPLVKLMVRDGTLAFAAFTVFTTVIVTYTLANIAYAVTGYSWLLSAVSCITCRLVINMQQIPTTASRQSGPLTSTNIQFTTVITDLNIDDVFSFHHKTRATEDQMDVDMEHEQDHEQEREEQVTPPPKPRASSVPLAPPNYTVGYVYSTEMLAHFSPHDYHPEQPARIQSIWQAFVREQLIKRMLWIPIREVYKSEALLAHTEDHWNKVIALQAMTDQERVDTKDFYEQMSLYVMPGTTRSALLSCGGVIEASLRVANGELKRSFAIVRPPGHHAEPDEHMGFCFFNNVAVAARVVQMKTKIKKILILDWDVHHGNGTQRAFNNDPSVLYMSLHRYEEGTFYPCGPFGNMTSCGEDRGLGYSVNVPWPHAGMGDAEYIYAFQKVIMPIAMEFSPELVIISAGFDAAAGDDLGECFVSPGGYAHMTHMLAGLAGGRLVVALEGGYNLDSISNSALAVVRILLGEAPPELGSLEAQEAAVETVWAVAREQSKYWKSVDPKACEPRDSVEPISFTLPEILKAHRQHHLRYTYDMMEIPLLSPVLEDRFSSQIMCTGNLRLELESSSTCDAQLERSYLIDVSKQLVGWAISQGYALLDANLYPKRSTESLPRKVTMEDIARDLLVYLWDNYILLSSAQKIILIGHGPGCRPLVELASKRMTSVTRRVRCISQVMGLQKMPSLPVNNEDLRNWYLRTSFIIVPQSHGILSPEFKPKDLRKHGTVIPIPEERPIKLMLKALPAIADIVKEVLSPVPPTNS